MILPAGAVAVVVIGGIGLADYTRTQSRLDRSSPTAARLRDASSDLVGLLNECEEARHGLPVPSEDGGLLLRSGCFDVPHKVPSFPRQEARIEQLQRLRDKEVANRADVAHGWHQRKPWYFFAVGAVTLLSLSFAAVRFRRA